MKKIKTITLILTLTLPFIGTYTWLQFEKHAIKRLVKQRMISGMGKEEFVFLKFHTDEKEDLYWEHSREFEYKDEMYDVVAQEQVGDTVYYRCWWDGEETELNKKVKQLVAFALGNDQQNKENQQRISQFIKSFYFETREAFQVSLTSEFNKHSSYYLFEYQSIKGIPTVPPPEFSI